MKKYIALVKKKRRKKKKKKDLYYVDVIILYIILVLQILLLYIELLPVRRNLPAITTLCQLHAVLWFIIRHRGHWKAILADRMNGWIRKIGCRIPPFILQTESTQPVVASAHFDLLRNILLNDRSNHQSMSGYQNNPCVSEATERDHASTWKIIFLILEKVPISHS